jgi:hypothetical protein
VAGDEVLVVEMELEDTKLLVDDVTELNVLLEELAAELKLDLVEGVMLVVPREDAVELDELVVTTPEVELVELFEAPDADIVVVEAVLVVLREVADELNELVVVTTEVELVEVLDVVEVVVVVHGGRLTSLL